MFKKKQNKQSTLEFDVKIFIKKRNKFPFPLPPLLCLPQYFFVSVDIWAKKHRSELQVHLYTEIVLSIVLSDN